MSWLRDMTDHTLLPDQSVAIFYDVRDVTGEEVLATDSSEEKKPNMSVLSVSTGLHLLQQSTVICAPIGQCQRRKPSWAINKKSKIPVFLLGHDEASKTQRQLSSIMTHCTT